MKSNPHYHSMPIEDWELIKEQLEELEALKKELNPEFTIKIDKRSFYSHLDGGSFDYYYSFKISNNENYNNTHISIIKEMVNRELQPFIDRNEKLLNELIKKKIVAEQAQEDYGKTWEANRLLYDQIVNKGWFSTLIYKLFYDKK